jgi:site-specific DNA-methyltransferase (adenine-specific)
MKTHLLDALRRAMRAGALVDGLPYGRAEVVRALAEVSGVGRREAARWLAALGSEPAELEELAVEVSGRGRKERLVFTAPPARAAPVPPWLSAGPGVRLDVYQGDNLPLLASFPDACFDLIYVDPPFNTGREQARTRLRTTADPGGDRAGFGGRRYRTERLGSMAYADHFGDYLGFLAPRLAEAQRLLTPTGALFVHLDPREVHYVKVLLDGLFGRDCFLGEIIWAYDYGARSKSRWPAKHDNILWYVQDPGRYVFNFDEMDRIPYMAPGLVGAEKAARGKTPTDVWWHTIVPTNGRERTGYPTQKPLGVLERIVKVHSRPGQRLCDFFAGSGTAGEAAVRLGRSAVLIDESADAVRVMASRLAFAAPVLHGCEPALCATPEGAGL